MLFKQKQRKRRHDRITAKIKGSKERPRLCVSRSNKYIYAQLINDDKGEVLACVRANKKISDARDAGKKIAEKSKEIKVEKIIFDRGGYKYHGRVKALAEGAREGGLNF